MLQEKLFQFMRISIAATFFVVVYTALVNAASGGSDPVSGSVSNEPQIFARVLKATLDSAGLGEFVRGPFGIRSPIETGIQADYIPTVGLLVRVPVSFPITAPTEVEAPEKPAPDSKDLWEKYSKSGLRVERDARVLKLQNADDSRGPVALDPNLVLRKEIKIDGPKNIHTSAKGDELDEAGKFFVERFAPKIDIMFNGLVAAPYEESRVTKLRETILEVVAQYGHRVSSVQEGERIIVLVEAPASGGPARVLLDQEDNEAIRELVPFHTRLDGKEERMLIAVPKSALLTESTRDAISAQVMEKRY